MKNYTAPVLAVLRAIVSAVEPTLGDALDAVELSLNGIDVSPSRLVATARTSLRGLRRRGRREDADE